MTPGQPQKLSGHQSGTGNDTPQGATLAPAEARAMLAEYLSLNSKEVVSYMFQSKDTEAGRRILALSREDLTVMVDACIADLAERNPKMQEYRDAHPKYDREKAWEKMRFIRMLTFVLLEAIFKKRLPFMSAQVLRIAEWMTKPEDEALSLFRPLAGFAALVEAHAEAGPLDPRIQQCVQALLAGLAGHQFDPGVRKAVQRMQLAAGGGPRIPVTPGEVWADATIASLEALPAEGRAAWIELMELCVQATGAKPSGKWLKQTEIIVRKRIGAEAFRGMLVAWFPLVDKPVPEEVMQANRAGGPTAQYRYSAYQILDGNADILRGLVWACEFAPSPDVHRALTALAFSSYKKVPGSGPRLIKVGNACIATLGAVGGLDAIGQLAILKVRIKFGTAQIMLEKALSAAAEKEGLPREELEEMSVPAYGLTEVGRATVELGETTAELAVAGSRSVDLVWKSAAGKILKSPPASVKTDFAEDLKELRQAQKDIERMLAAQAERLDHLFLARRSWSLATWRERYLDHPLVGTLARRLIWKFQIGDSPAEPALWNEGRLETLNGALLETFESTIVTIWHPLDSPGTVRAWRERVESLRIRQPFKQAHREVYVLTPAEENTGVYSNRFATHVLKQHQFNALCGQRGWKNELRLMVDGGYSPTHRNLREWNLRAEFWVDGIGSVHGVDTNEVGTYLYISTDQVRFYPIGAPQLVAHGFGRGHRPIYREQVGQPLPLRDIPPLVFSEIMRDVDLFVGVCSVGNDPSWSDGGPGGRQRDYWTNYSFGELTGSAASRKEILERLVPRLKIASKCRFSDRFLIVQGALHEYKIHLGSGNILMSPDDRYLCIVARQSVSKAGETVFLPFEGDNTLSLVLSKAFLLANDTAITDQTIIQQIGKLPEKN